MNCDPSDNTINIPTGEPFPGLFLAPIQPPFPVFDIPTDLLEDLLELLQSLGLLFPSGLFKPNIDNFTKDLFDLISNLLSQIAPFLSFYNFIMALFKLVLCIIEVLCAIPNPFKIAAAMVKLFTECLPPFLNLFPWLALIAMIIALILLIIALIEYIIATILAIIEEFIRNVLILTKGFQFNDATSTLAAIQKIAELLCLIQNILAIFVALAAIMAVIQALAMFGGAPVCEDDSQCCDGAVCPSFIKNSPWDGTQATLLYNPQVGLDMATAFPDLDPALAELMSAAIPPPRKEMWQLYDDTETAPYNFAAIITPVVDLSTFPPVSGAFWPEGLTFTSDTPSSRAPYNVDIKLELDPAQFNAADTGGTRVMWVKDCITVRKPTPFTTSYNNVPDLFTGTKGVLYLEGGLVYEENGETAYEIDGEQATLNTFIHQENILGTELPNDTITFENIQYTFKPVYGALMGATLITAGCMPEVAAEKATMNAVIIAEDVRAVVEKLAPVPIGSSVKALPSLGILPNIEGAQECVLTSLQAFRDNVSLEQSAIFQADVQACLGDLREQAMAVVCGAVAAAASQFKSEIALDTDVQFTSRTIKTSVILKDANSTAIASKLPDDCATSVQDKMLGEVTLGEISGFVYDSLTGVFNASISSDKPGDGTLTVTFNGKVLSRIVPATDTTTTQIEEKSIPYTFIDAPDEPAVRRDGTDVAAQGAKR